MSNLQKTNDREIEIMKNIEVDLLHELERIRATLQIKCIEIKQNGNQIKKQFELIVSLKLCICYKSNFQCFLRLIRIPY